MEGLIEQHIQDLQQDPLQRRIVLPPIVAERARRFAAALERAVAKRAAEYEVSRLYTLAERGFFDG